MTTFRNFALWVIVVLLLLALFTLFQTSSPRPRTDAQEISYSQFINEVDSGRVRSVVIQGPEIHGNFTDGRSFWTHAPNDPTLMQRLLGKGVSVTARSQQSEVPWIVSLLVSWLPFFLLIGVWIFLSRQMQQQAVGHANRPDSEIAALKRQIEDLKREIDRLKGNPKLPG